MVYEEYSLPDWCRIQINDERRDALDEVLRGPMYMHEDTDSVRSPGWYEAGCIDHDNSWHTSGDQSNVEDEAYEHAATHLSEAFRTRRDALWRLVEAHDGQHECTDLTASAEPYVGCTTLRLLAMGLWSDKPGYRGEEWAP